MGRTAGALPSLVRVLLLDQTSKKLMADEFPKVCVPRLRDGQAYLRCSVHERVVESPGLAQQTTKH